jgi:folate-binding protein YgfZ
VPVVHLSDRAVLALGGADARPFLNGLVTQDIVALPDASVCYAGLLSPQGKALFDMFVQGNGPELLIDVAAARATDLLKRLTMYKLRAKVRLGLRPDLAVLAGWQNSPYPDAACHDPRLALMGWRWIGPVSALSPDASLQDYHSHRISHGVPDTADIGTDQLLWLETNADLLNGVSFTKGCYVGQENTARMHHRAKVRKRLCRVISTEGLPISGTPILAGNREAGHLLSVMGDQGLALIRLEYLETGAALTAAGEPVRLEMPTGIAEQI